MPPVIGCLTGLYAKFTSPKMNFCFVNKILTCIFQEISNTIVHVRNAERGTKKNNYFDNVFIGMKFYFLFFIDV